MVKRTSLARYAVAVFVAGGLVAGLVGAALAASLEARTDRTRLSVGETLTLTLRYRGERPAAPDLAPLERDFEVLNTSQVQRQSIVNGRADRSIDWQVVLSPLREGTLEIPAITVGDATARPLDVAVGKRPSPLQDGSAPDIFVEAEVDIETPVVQGKVLYTIRLYDGVGITGGGLSDPETTGLMVERLGEDSRYRTTVNGRDYQVIERRYALFPQEAGPVTVPPAVFEGTVPVQNGRGGGIGGSPLGGGLFGSMPGGDPFAQMRAQMDQMRQQMGMPQMPGFGSAFGGGLGGGLGGGSLFDSFFGGGGQQVRAMAPAITLDVTGQPADAAGWWLPAEEVRLVEKWQPDPPVFRVGDTISRTVAIQARGVKAEQLPELAPLVMGDVPGLGQYPEPAAFKTFDDNDGTVAVRQESFTLVPGQEGEVVLPPVIVDWYDTGAGEQKQAMLPAYRIDVLPAGAAATAGAGQPEALEVRPPAAAGGSLTPSGARSPAIARQLFGFLEQNWLLLAVGLASMSGVVIGWGALGQRLARCGSNNHAVPKEKASQQRAAERSKKAELDAAFADLKASCRANRPSGALSALGRWGAAKWPDGRARTADAVAQRLGDPAFARLVEDANALLYSPDDGAERWDGGHFLAAFAAAERSASGHREKPSSLPDLYPNSA